MPRGVYSNYTCKEKHGKFKPQEHQIFIKNYFIKSKYKGLLLYHRLGSGKTCSGIITADALLQLKNIKAVYLLTPGSLRQGWIKEYCGVCGAEEKLLTNKYTFITYNYNVANYLPTNFNNSLVIIDEVHNLINGVKNQSKTATIIYAKLMASKCRILALSGTPIFNNIYEWSLLGNLLKPGSMPPIISPTAFMNMFKPGSMPPIISQHLDTTAFMNMFNIDNDGYVTAKKPKAFKKAVEGIISYFPGLGGGYYPTVIEEPIIKVMMTPEQEKRYWSAYKTEQKWLRPLDPALAHSNPAQYNFLKRMLIMAKKRILSRQPSNFVYPDDVYEATVVVGDIKKKPKDAVAPAGWVKRKYFSDGQLKKVYSSKMAKLFENILNNFRSKHMVFTFFKEHSGVNIMKAIFELCGLRTEVFSGDLTDKKRAELLSEFNSPANRYGDKIKVIFVTDAGAEGITLLETGHVHILESDPRENKIQQAIGRAVRFKSHIKMPKDEQVVHIWRYWSLAKGDKDSTQKKSNDSQKTIDEQLYEEGQKKMNTLNSFLQLLIDASIENIVI